MAAPVRGPRRRWEEQLRRPVAAQGVKVVRRGRHGAQYVLRGSLDEEEEEGDRAAACSGPKWAHTGLCDPAEKLGLEMSICES